jgi:glycerol uptake operon antiterminator
MDFLDGISKDNIGLDYVIDELRPDGIISTKAFDIKYAAQKGIFTVQRFFLLDSQSISHIIKTAPSVNPCIVEIMPAIIPEILAKVSKKIKIPIIAGGLIDNKDDIMKVLNSGVIGVSTGKKDLWNI